MLNQSKHFTNLALCLTILFLNFSPIAVLAQDAPPASNLTPEQIAWENRLKKFDQLIYKATQKGTLLIVLDLKGEEFNPLGPSELFDEEYEKYQIKTLAISEQFLKRHEQLRPRVRSISELSPSIRLSLNASHLASLKYDKEVINFFEDTPEFLPPSKAIVRPN